MSTPINDGGPAFPETRWHDATRQEVQWTGMTLRDYFAGQALAGFMSTLSHDYGNRDEPSRYAQDSYQLADAMIAKRERGAE